MNTSIVFVGGGNMATSLISGLRHADWSGERITVIEPDDTKAQKLRADYGVNVASSADSQSLDADVIVLAVKPQMMREVCEGLVEPLGDRKPLVVSIAAGVPIAAFRQWLGADHAYVRCMPNTPSLIGAGATGLYADNGVTDAQRSLADSILETAGMTAWVAEESLLDAVTATSGSGPAYFFAFMEAMQAGAVELGLDEAAARELVLHTALGAARMAIESGDDPATLREKVTSPGGTTAAALEQYAAGDLNALVARAMQAAAGRADSLATELLDK
ncbi:pyrroline-5-carboxylate reductase [Salinisphaera sp.]|uniref:pyrroline-5-carboxylate reductase n=1 Tax=Salinisphaera sp. TaxID=1914330 RepID=UPI000C615C4E|nr:pyrroline-5-carboxylate reductase [Salinisphaera sp.]MBS63808.1 pyrroline-5-carboxylate reductase [Salinisphaera sp.]